VAAILLYMQQHKEYKVLPLADLKPYPGNARKHNDDKLQGSVGVHGQFRTLVVRETENGDGPEYTILAGHGTKDALEAKGVPQARVEILVCSDEEALQINLVDNATNDAADYFKDLLASQLERAAEFDFEGTGWTQEEFDKMRGRGDDDEPDLPEDPPHWGVVVECTSEEQQARLLEQLSEEGFSVRALMA
jgi:ParB-like chromosome segregation protein Spo0J